MVSHHATLAYLCLLLCVMRTAGIHFQLTLMRLMGYDPYFRKYDKAERIALLGIEKAVDVHTVCALLKVQHFCVVDPAQVEALAEGMYKAQKGHKPYVTVPKDKALGWLQSLKASVYICVSYLLWRKDRHTNA